MTDLSAPASLGRHVPGLPALGWCATTRRDAPRPDVVLGELVETAADSFFEGIWDGPFPELGFLRSPIVMGSGARVEDGATHFCSPTHTLDALYCLRDDDAVHVANSLPLLLARVGDGPDPRCRTYRADVAALWRGGTPASPIALPTARGRSVLVHVATNLVVGPDLSVDVVDKPQVPEPHDYASYYEILAGTVDRLVTNGRDPHRRTPLRSAVTLSSGYDSSASAVLGARAGIEYAITLTQESFTDDGSKVAEVLGLRVESLDRDAWQRSVPPLEIEFMASNGGPSAITLGTIEDGWRGSMILLGGLGDQMWDLGHPLMGEAQSIPDGLNLTQLGLHDFRLRAGVTFVHVPSIGAVHARAVARISKSDEMAPWRLGRMYDRPVPRRIVEDAGVPRSGFAVRKRAGAAVDPDDVLRPEVRADFEQYWRSLVRSLPVRLRWRWRFDAHVVTPTIRATRIALFRMRWRRFTWKPTRRNLGRWYFYKSLPSAYRFHWSVQELTDRFEAALESDRGTDTN